MFAIEWGIAGGRFQSSTEKVFELDFSLSEIGGGVGFSE